MEKFIDKLLKDENVGLMGMYYMCLEKSNSDSCDNDLYWDNIYTYDELKGVLIQHIEDDDVCLEAILTSVEEHKQLYLFDWSCYGLGAAPIKTKEELKEALLTGNI